MQSPKDRRLLGAIAGCLVLANLLASLPNPTPALARNPVFTTGEIRPDSIMDDLTGGGLAGDPDSGEGKPAADESPETSSVEIGVVQTAVGPETVPWYTSLRRIFTWSMAKWFGK